MSSRSGWPGKGAWVSIAAYQGWDKEQRGLKDLLLPVLVGSASIQGLLACLPAGQFADMVEPALVAESISNLTGLLPQLVTVQAVQYDAALTIALPGVVPNISVSGHAVLLSIVVQMAGTCPTKHCAGYCVL